MPGPHMLLAEVHADDGRTRQIQRAIDKIVKKTLKNIDVPDELQEQVETMLTKEPGLAWDDAIFKLAKGEQLEVYPSLRGD